MNADGSTQQVVPNREMAGLSRAAAFKRRIRRRDAWCSVRDSLAVALVLGWLAYRYVDWTFFTGLDPRILSKWWPSLAAAAGISLAITACAMALGLALGVGIAIAITVTRFRAIRTLLAIYIEIWRNTPLIVLLFWIHFGLPTLTGISTTAFVSGFVALALQSSAYLADIARGGIQAVDEGQWRAAYALGLPARSRWLEIVLPQAFRVMIPALSNLAISFLNASALLGLLHVGELMTVAAKISDYTMHPIEIMTLTAVFYLLCNLVITFVTARIEKRLWKSHRGRN